MTQPDPSPIFNQTIWTGLNKDGPDLRESARRVLEAFGLHLPEAVPTTLAADVAQMVWSDYCQVVAEVVAAVVDNTEPIALGTYIRESREALYVLAVGLQDMTYARMLAKDAMPELTAFHHPSA